MSSHLTLQYLIFVANDFNPDESAEAHKQVLRGLLRTSEFTSVVLDSCATNNAVLDTAGTQCASSSDPSPAASLQSRAKGCLRLTTYTQGTNIGQNGVILVRQNLLSGGTE